MVLEVELRTDRYVLGHLQEPRCVCSIPPRSTANPFLRPPTSEDDRNALRMKR